MKNFIFSILFILTSIHSFSQKKEIRYMVLKDETEASYTISKDSTRASFAIKKFDATDNSIEEKTYFGFSHRKATKIVSLPLIKLEDYYADPKKYVLGNRIYIVIPLKDKTFAIWKCSLIGTK